jgi:hypothetical protein
MVSEPQQFSRSGFDRELCNSRAGIVDLTGAMSTGYVSRSQVRGTGIDPSSRTDSRSAHSA